MNLYLITIEDELFGKMAGAFKAESEEAAQNEAKDFYAMANDTYIDNIEIVETDLIGETIEKNFEECLALHGREDYTMKDFLGAEYFPEKETLVVNTGKGTFVYREGTEDYFNVFEKAYRSI